VFAVGGDVVYWAVDHKPKRSTRLKRLANIEANPNVEMVADGYDEEWSNLWWVRASGPARVVQTDDERARALELLSEKHPQYRARPPEGPVIAIEIVRVTGWSAND
jgi:PPOX class probable F420-dependent enzyme